MFANWGPFYINLTLTKDTYLTKTVKIKVGGLPLTSNLNIG